MKSWTKPLPPRPKARPSVVIGAAALGTYAPGSGLYVHGVEDREAYAQTVLDAVGHAELERLAARLWTENELMRRQIARLEGTL